MLGMLRRQFVCFVFFFFNQNTSIVLLISDWISDVCSSNLVKPPHHTIDTAWNDHADRHLAIDRAVGRVQRTAATVEADLGLGRALQFGFEPRRGCPIERARRGPRLECLKSVSRHGGQAPRRYAPGHPPANRARRSDERRVGKGGGRTSGPA